MIEMTREDFDTCVADALDRVPPELLGQLDNVVILVEEDSPPNMPELLGMYDGIPLTDRDTWYGAGTLPDRVFVYMNPTLRACSSVEEVTEQVWITVVHELGHFFGIDDDRLHDLGWA